MVERSYTIKALDHSTWTAFAALVECNNGIFGGCWCIGFHPEGGDRAAQGEVNRERKHDRVRSGTAHARTQTTSPDWRIACCYVGKGHRRQGVATAALAGALDLIAALGGGTVEGYPEDAGAVPAGFLFNGALSTYEKLGFARDRKIGKHRWVMIRDVEPAP